MQASDGVLEAQVGTGSKAAAELRLQRLLKVVVVGLAILLFAGLAAIAWRVIYLASPSARQPEGPAPAVGSAQSLPLPRGAQVRSIALSGNRLAVHYETAQGAKIAVFDLQSGRTVADVAVEPQGAGRD